MSYPLDYTSDHFYIPISDQFIFINSRQMFHRQTKDSRPLVNQVAMIESRFEHQNLDIFEAIKLPATIFHRSPLRQRFSNSNANTSRQGTPVKKNPSPVMSRRDSNVSTRSFLNSQAQPASLIKTSKMRMTVRDQTNQMVKTVRQQPLQIVGTIKQVPMIKTERDPPMAHKQAKLCSNNIHDQKPATYIVKSEQQQLLYCEKCAILLASQGFKVRKIQTQEKVMLESVKSKNLEMSLESANMRSQALNQLQNTQRRSEITLFLNDIKTIFYQLKERKSELKNIRESNHLSSNQLNKMISQYFQQIIEIVKKQKKLVIEEMEKQRSKISQESQIEIKQLGQYMDDCSMMSDDIFSSIEVIRKVDDKAFRKVMQTYKLKCKGYVDIINKDLPSLLTVGSLNLYEIKKVSQAIVGMTKLNFIPKQQSAKPKENRVYFSFQKQKQENKTETQNQHIQDLVQADQRYIKKFDDSAQYDS